jgi:23S rRNA (guanine745-N1)-methyltransferase
MILAYFYVILNFGESMKIIKCPVCNNELKREGKSYKCLNNHCFDLAKYDYANLLLANQFHSLNPGDDKEMVIARKEFFKLDKYACLKKALLETILKYQNEQIVFCDLACGEGYYTNYLHSELLKRREIVSFGIDISKYAIIESSKEKRKMDLDNIEYLIANLNHLPFFDNSFSLLLNCFAPIDEKEFYRVLKNKGIYLRVLPGDDHLYKRKEENLEGFVLEEEILVRDRIKLETNQDILNLFKMTPYYYKTSKESIAKLASLDSLETNISFLIRVYRVIK